MGNCINYNVSGVSIHLFADTEFTIIIGNVCNKWQVRPDNAQIVDGQGAYVKHCDTVKNSLVACLK